jgi:hypothetical protein
MLSPATLERLIEHADWERLLGEVLRNGRPLPLEARMRLLDSDAAAPAALGLALQRMIELSYAPGARERRALERLLAMQRADGGFGSPAATASAAAGLIAFQEHAVAALGGAEEGFFRRLNARIEEALHALFAARERGLFDGSGEGGLIGDALDTALVLWRLDGASRFEARIGGARVRAALEEAARARDPRVRSLLGACVRTGLARAEGRSRRLAAAA